MISAIAKIEPGMRECVAIVLMPSFVPYADFTVRSNWFKLTNPPQCGINDEGYHEIQQGDHRHAKLKGSLCPLRTLLSSWRN